MRMVRGTGVLSSSRSHVLRAVPPHSQTPRAGARPFLCHANDRFQLQLTVRPYATAPANKSFAVLGGGITGLTTAKYLSEAFPDAQITVLEKSNRLGGWMHTHHVTADGREVTFESGPRSLRPTVPNGTLALRLIEDLGLTESLVVTPKDHPAAKNRFIYYPDRLVRLPSSGSSILERLRTIISSGLFSGTLKSFLNVDLSSVPERPEDQSVGDYMSKYIGEPATNNAVSAAFHGIYAGDIWQLSARSILSTLWEQEKRQTSLLGFAQSVMIRKELWNFTDDIQLQMLLQQGQWSETVLSQFQNASVFSFKKGIQELPEKLVEYLRQKPNVNLITGAAITSLTRQLGSGQDKVVLSRQGDSSKHEQSFDHVVSTISSRATFALLGQETTTKTPDLHALNRTHAVNVAVINLYFPTTNLLKKLRLPRQPIFSQPLCGFGYLIPNSISLAENPERALGVIFDSDIFAPGSDAERPAEQGTRLTVMMGGHWWDDWADLPSESDCFEMARSVLRRHLGIEEAPAASKVTIQRECIPQYHVGHSRRMAQAHDGLKDAFGGRLLVAGSWYSGVGVNDCLRAAFEVVHTLRTRVKGTGLESFKEGRGMSLVRRQRPGVVEVLRMEDDKGRVPYERWK